LSAGDALLIFLDRTNEFEGWLHLGGGAVAARGSALEGLPALVNAETGEALRQVAVVPGDAVAIHWLELPSGLAPAQAIAAARLMAAEVSAQPVADMHVAVGPEVEGESSRAVALVPALTMAGWIGRLQAQAIDPDLVLPEPLLLPRPDEGYIRFDGGNLPLFRGPNDAFSMEPELAEIVLPRGSFANLTPHQFEAGIPEALANPAVNLRQGPFAKRRRWKLEWKLIRRLAALALGILLVTLAIQVVNILRYTYAADDLEAEATRIAAQAIPNVTAANAPAYLERRVADLGGNGAGYGSISAAVFAAVRDTPNVELTNLVFDRGGSLRATIQADSPATVSAFQARVEAGGFIVEAAPLRAGAGRPVAELTVRAR
jgi:general secretion pathway protein L